MRGPPTSVRDVPGQRRRTIMACLTVHNGLPELLDRLTDLRVLPRATPRSADRVPSPSTAAHRWLPSGHMLTPPGRIGLERHHIPAVKALPHSRIHIQRIRHPPITGRTGRLLPTPAPRTAPRQRSGTRSSAVASALPSSGPRPVRPGLIASPSRHRITIERGSPIRLRDPHRSVRDLIQKVAARLLRNLGPDPESSRSSLSRSMPRRAGRLITHPDAPTNPHTPPANRDRRRDQSYPSPAALTMVVQQTVVVQPARISAPEVRRLLSHRVSPGM